MEQRLQEVFARVFKGKVRFSPELSQEKEPRWDSLRHVELLVGIEKEFGIRFDGSDAVELVSVQAILAALRERSGAA